MEKKQERRLFEEEIFCSRGGEILRRKSLKQGTLCSEKRFVSGVVLRRKRFMSRNFVGKHSVWTSFVVKRMQVLQNFDKSTTDTKFNPKSINPIQTPKKIQSKIKSNQKSNSIPI